MQPPICLLALLSFLILATMPSFSQMHGVHFHFKPLPAVLPRIRIHHMLLTSVSAQMILRELFCATPPTYPITWPLIFHTSTKLYTFQSISH